VVRTESSPRRISQQQHVHRLQQSADPKTPAGWPAYRNVAHPELAKPQRGDLSIGRQHSAHCDEYAGRRQETGHPAGVWSFHGVGVSINRPPPDGVSEEARRLEAEVGVRRDRGRTRTSTSNVEGPG
jgi:hypothetical protein